MKIGWTKELDCKARIFLKIKETFVGVYRRFYTDTDMRFVNVFRRFRQCSVNENQGVVAFDAIALMGELRIYISCASYKNFHRTLGTFSFADTENKTLKNQKSLIFANALEEMFN